MKSDELRAVLYRLDRENNEAIAEREEMLRAQQEAEALAAPPEPVTLDRVAGLPVYIHLDEKGLVPLGAVRLGGLYQGAVIGDDPFIILEPTP